MRRVLPRLALAGVLLLLVGLAGCSSDASTPAGDDPGSTDASSSATTAATPPASAEASEGVETVSYVALGDSYQAAPGVPDTSGEDGCFRSDHNYPHLMADADPRLDLTDVTCSGADSDSVVAQQVPELSARTDLVTIGIGGNDLNLFTDLLGQCLRASREDPDGAPCTEAAGSEVDELLPGIGTSVGTALDAVDRAAPNAQVLVVGYPSLLPRSGSCFDRLPLASGDYPLLRRVNTALSDALHRQARQRDLAFVDVARASDGHDICAARPWVNGIDVAPDGTIPFHPLEREQRAVARLVAARVRATP